MDPLRRSPLSSGLAAGESWVCSVVSRGLCCGQWVLIAFVAAAILVVFCLVIGRNVYLFFEEGSVRLRERETGAPEDACSRAVPRECRGN